MPTLITITPGLNHEGHEGFIKHATKTYSGMAHLAGTGPEGTTCRECVFWDAKWKWSIKWSLQDGPGVPVPSQCRKFRQLAHKGRGGAIPHNAPSCKHFFKTDRPQPLHRPPKEEDHDYDG